MSESTSAPRWRRPAIFAGVALLVAALPVAAFVSYGVWTRSGEIVYERGGETFGADTAPLPAIPPAPSTATSPPAPRVAPTTSGDPGRPAVPSAVAAARPVTGPAPAVATPRAAGKAGPWPARPAVVARAEPVAGTYPLRVDGSEKVTFGPFSFCGRDLAKGTALVVAPARNEAAGSYNFDVRYFPGETGKHDERHIYRYANGAVDLAFESATVTCSGVRQGSDISYSPVQRCIIAPLKVGARWSGTGGDADRTEQYTSTVTGVDSLEIDGLRIPVFVIDTRTVFTGSESGERTRRWWYAPSLAMPVKWTDTTSGGRSGAKYSSEITVTVAGLPAAAAAVLEAGGR